MPELLPMTDEDRQLIERQRRQAKRMRASAYWVADAKRLPEVLKWSDRHLVNQEGAEKRLAKALTSSSRFVPPELLASGNGKQRGNTRAKRALSAKELKALEESEGREGEGGGGEKKDDEDDLREDDGEDAGDDNLDYGNAYDSAGDDDPDDDGGGGDDGAYF